MASHLRLKLPPLRATLRPTSGRIETKLIYREDSDRKSLQCRGRLENDAEERHGTIAVSAREAEAGSSGIDSDILYGSSDFELDEAFSEGPSLYKIQKQANACSRMGKNKARFTACCCRE